MDLGTIYDMYIKKLVRSDKTYLYIAGFCLLPNPHQLRKNLAIRDKNPLEIKLTNNIYRIIENQWHIKSLDSRDTKGKYYASAHQVIGIGF